MIYVLNIVSCESRIYSKKSRLTFGSNYLLPHHIICGLSCVFLQGFRFFSQISNSVNQAGFYVSSCTTKLFQKSWVPGTLVGPRQILRRILIDQ